MRQPRSRRKAALARRKLKELPQDDGMIPILGRDRYDRLIWLLARPEDIQTHFAQQMAKHDERDRLERWGGNQWGEEWVQKPSLRGHYAARMPLLKTDRGYKDWCRDIRR